MQLQEQSNAPLAGVIWDIDGTLCDTLPLVVETFRTIYARHLGRALDDAAIISDFGPTEGGSIRKRLPHAWQAIEREYVEEYARGLVDARVFPGIPELLAELCDRGVRLAVVTGKGQATARLTLEHFGLARFFERVEAGSPDGNVKPDCFRRVLAGWASLAPATIACVGDTPGDAKAARSVGAIAVRARWSIAAGSKVGEADEADEHFEAPAAMLAWVRSLPASANDAARQTVASAPE